MLEISHIDIESIQIQTIDNCNRSCNFCPNSKGIRKTNNIMDRLTFDIVIDRLSEIKYKGRISPYLMNEPLLDKRIFSLIKHIRNRFKDNIIFLNSNGDLIKSKEVLSSLLNSGVDGIQINCYDGIESYNNRKLTIESWCKFSSNIEIHNSGSLRKMKTRNNKLNIRIKNLGTDSGAFWNRGGNVEQISPKGRYSTIDFCEFPFKQMYINYRGEAILCCSDYYFNVIMGSLIKDDISHVWHGEKYKIYRNGLISHKYNSLELCKNCNRIS